MERKDRLSFVDVMDRDALARLYDNDVPMMTVTEAAGKLGLAPDTLRRRLYRSGGGSIRLASVAGAYIAPLDEWAKLGGQLNRGPKHKRSAE